MTWGQEHSVLAEDPSSVPSTHVLWLTLPETPAPENLMLSSG